MGLGSRLRRHRHALGAVALLIVLLAGGALARAGFRRAAADPPGAPPAPARVPVVVAPARTRDIGVYLDGARLGHPAQHRDGAQPGGRPAHAHAVPGRSDRAAGDLLAEIDPRPFQTQLTQAEAQLAKDAAALANARMDLERYRTLVKSGSSRSSRWTPRPPRSPSSGHPSRPTRARSTAFASSSPTRASRPHRRARRASPGGSRQHVRPPIRAAWSSSPSSSRSPWSSRSRRTASRRCWTSSGAGGPAGGGLRPRAAHEAGGGRAAHHRQPGRSDHRHGQASRPSSQHRQPAVPESVRQRPPPRGLAARRDVVPTAAIQPSAQGPFVYLVRPDRTVGRGPPGRPAGVTAGVTTCRSSEALSVEEQVASRSAEREPATREHRAADRAVNLSRPSSCGRSPRRSSWPRSLLAGLRSPTACCRSRPCPRWTTRPSRSSRSTRARART